MWSYFNIITYLTIALWLVGGGLIYSKSKALRGFAITSHLVATVLMEGIGASALAYLGRNTYMVCLLYGADRLCDLPAL